MPRIPVMNMVAARTLIPSVRRPVITSAVALTRVCLGRGLASSIDGFAGVVCSVERADLRPVKVNAGVVATIAPCLRPVNVNACVVATIAPCLRPVKVSACVVATIAPCLRPVKMRAGVVATIAPGLRPVKVRLSDNSMIWFCAGAGATGNRISHEAQTAVAKLAL